MARPSRIGIEPSSLSSQASIGPAFRHLGQSQPIIETTPHSPVPTVETVVATTLWPTVESAYHAGVVQW